ncbi:hypothetical protein O0I10_005082 [Lichtheimia ornata]|uniref:DUF6924 domain-containing protein n=1 Tax=Lichtheimia ornata TaxID=688661 RepID=A0AAD7XVZ1_9FUNG|nr:uncharacterized protein O0I10_005082 [Lichtheimia ornata]KAJ8659044.1 hypothetical protein O0I10_005082 [Lichtheimia ornata]
MGNMDGICCFVSVPMSAELRERLSGSKYGLHNALFFVEDSVGDVDRETYMASIHYDDMTYAICDQETINNNTVIFVDRETKNTFKCTTQSAALIAVNLALGNVGFEEYQDEADSNQGIVDFPEEYF